MKKLFLILNFFISFFLFESNSNAQSITLDSIAGFPDTVQNGQQVSMTMWFSNTGAGFSGDLAILMNSTQHDPNPDTIFYNLVDSFGGNGIIETLQVFHTFNAADLDGGDNIVVVWPSSSQASVHTDSLTFHLVLKNVGVSENERSQVIELYPTPVYDILRLRMSHPEKVEQVRVYDVLGNELMDFIGPVERFSVESLSSGVYFVLVRNKDQSMVVKKFFRE